jgi:hypothetical protein
LKAYRKFSQGVQHADVGLRLIVDTAASPDA